MDRAVYVAELRRVLDTASDEVAGKLRAILELATEDVTGVEVTVFPSQDGNGAFYVYAGLDGENASGLATKTAACRDLFGVVESEDGWAPDVPAFGPAPDFDLQSTIVDTVADWIEDLWLDGPGRRSSVPCEVTSPDGYGMTTPRLIESV